eukprot:scpid64159/ scgid11129/ 
MAQSISAPGSQRGSRNHKPNDRRRWACAPVCTAIHCHAHAEHCIQITAVHKQTGLLPSVARRAGTTCDNGLLQAGLGGFVYMHVVGHHHTRNAELGPAYYGTNYLLEYLL